MKIKDIKINAYGNLENKEINLSDNLNIVYGKNEAGKSTLLKFIVNTFYGTSKNKKGKEYSDYDRYKPWGKDDFSGKIKYCLDNNEEYEVFREFGKKSPKIYNSNLEDITKNFSVDKTAGNQFFYEQTKVDENTFLATIASMQQEVRLEKNSQNVLIQKMANIAGSGEDNVSYKKALDKLYKRQLDEIGTSRSQGKPINVAQNRLNELRLKKNELLQYKNLKYEFEENRNEIDDKIIANECKLEMLKKIKNLNEKDALENEKLYHNISLIKKDEKEILDLINEKNRILEENDIESEQILKKDYNSKIENVEVETKKEESTVKVGLKKYVLMLILIVIVNILLFIFLSDNYLKFIGLIGFIVIFIMYFAEKNTLKNKLLIEKNKKELNKKVEENKKLSEFEKNKKVLEEINIVNAKIEIFENDKREQLKVIEEIKSKISSLKNIEQEKIKNEYRNKIDIYEINKLINEEEVNYKIEEVSKEINDLKLDLHRIDLNKENILPQLEDLARIEEKLSIVENEYIDLIKKNDAFIVVKEALEKAYEHMKNNVTPKFTQSLSANINEITNGKYSKVSINDENGLMVELASGEYVSAEKLSLGTIDQLYLSLRLSMNNDVSIENMPIILDEAFAYYDEERLENILKYLIDKYGNKQIIIFTCTNREENILNKFGYQFNKIML